MLLGLLREEEGLAGRVLEDFGLTVLDVRREIVRIVGEGEEVTDGQIPFTPRAKRVLELASREALSLGHNYIGTEHVLLGLVRDSEGIAARILLERDLDSEKVRNAVIRMLAGPTRSVAREVPSSPRVAAVERVLRNEIEGYRKPGVILDARVVAEAVVAAVSRLDDEQVLMKEARVKVLRLLLREAESSIMVSSDRMRDYALAYEALVGAFAVFRSEER